MRIKLDPIIVLFIGIIIGVFLSYITKAEAYTVYETPAPISEFQQTGTASTSFYVERIRLPLGTTFSVIQYTALGTNKLYGASIFSDNGTPFESCNDGSCISDDITIVDLTRSNYIQPNDQVSQFTVPTTTITQSNQYLLFNTPQEIGTGKAVYFGGPSYDEDGYNNNRSPRGTAFRLCLGNCDNSEFSPLPLVTASPWARLLSLKPSINSYSTINLGIQVNTGTTTADNITVRYNSNFQSIAPDNFDLTVTGLNTFNFTKNFPAIDDTILLNITMYDGTTTVYTSIDYEIKITPTQFISDPNVDTFIDCEGLNVLAKPFCQAIVYLFMPSSATLDRFSNLYTSLDTIKPFGYFTTALSTLQNVNSSSTPAYTMPNIPFIDTIFTPLKTGLGLMLWGVFLFVFYNKRLKNIDI